jgi:hypothetical protein
VASEISKIVDLQKKKTSVTDLDIKISRNECGMSRSFCLDGEIQ